MRLLVTGGAGFIGSNFIHHVLENHKDWSIVNLDKLTYAGNLDNLARVMNHPKHTFVKGDILDKALVEDLMKEVDAVVHFAAESHVDRSIEGAEVFVKTNVLGTFVLLEAARRAHVRFHHVSTDEVFGSLGETGFFSESSPYDPRSPYSASKAASDHLVRSYANTYHLPVTISNCGNNFGPYQFPEKVIPLFVTNLMEGKKVPVYGEGKNKRDWIFVTDHCRAIVAILEKGKLGETYCVGGVANISNLDLTRQLLTLFGKGDEAIEFVEDRKGHDFRYAIDDVKLRKELGWKPLVSFEEGLNQTVEWYKKNEFWWRKLKGCKS